MVAEALWLERLEVSFTLRRQIDTIRRLLLSMR
jgi:hypothetical protein